MRRNQFVATNVSTSPIMLFKKHGLMILALITSITGLVSALAMYFVLSSKLIMGWDTSAYLYLTRVIAEIGLQKYLELTTFGTNGLLYYFLLYALYTATGASLFVLEKVLTSILFAGILMSVPFVTYRWTKNPNLSLVSLLLALGWPAPYILASNLHSNLLGFLFILLALAFLPDGLLSSSRAYVATIVLIFLASLSHPQSVVYFGIVIAASSSLALVSSTHRKTLFLKIVFLLLASFTQIIISVVLSGSLRIFGPLLYPGLVVEGGITTISVGWGLKVVAYIMLPIVIFSVFFILNRIIKLYRVPSRQRESIIYLTLLVWAVSTFAFWFLSYILPVLNTYVERLLMIFPSPLLLIFGFAKIWGDLSQRKQK
jgi:hypothetical protein